VLESVRSDDLFKYVSIEPAEYWRTLLFKDRFNFAGDKGEGEENKIVQRWNICDHLPEVTRRAFKLTSAEYIRKVTNYNRDLAKKGALDQVSKEEED